MAEGQVQFNQSEVGRQRIRVDLCHESVDLPKYDFLFGLPEEHEKALQEMVNRVLKI